MKKLVLAGLLAVAVLAVTQQQASAWINSRFSIGLNWGGNNFFWGGFKNGQPPGPEAWGYQGHGYMPSHHHGYAPMPQAMPQPMPAQNAQQVQPMYYGPYQFANYPRPIYYYPAPSYFHYYYAE
jgi:hypothetical protein